MCQIVCLMGCHNRCNLRFSAIPANCIYTLVLGVSELSAKWWLQESCWGYSLLTQFGIKNLYTSLLILIKQFVGQEFMSVLHEYCSLWVRNTAHCVAKGIITQDSNIASLQFMYILHLKCIAMHLTFFQMFIGVILKILQSQKMLNGY